MRYFFLLLVSFSIITFAGEPSPASTGNKKTFHSKLYIVIHGTWGHESEWYLPEGDFLKTIEKRLAPYTVLSFTWSGRNSHLSRILAGKQLKKVIESYSPETEIYLISHSHGGTVSALATQFLGQNPDNRHKIKVMLNLGTPVDPSRYLPDYEIVEFVINMFSFNDLVQTVWGHCKREYPTRECTANLRTQINGKEPDHSQLHSPIIAYWIPTILTQLIENLDTTVISPYQQAMIINITANNEPTYSQDHWRTIDIKLDEGIQNYRGTGINSTWETFFRVLFNYSPGASHDHGDASAQPTLAASARKLIRHYVKMIKKIASSILSPLYD